MSQVMEIALTKDNAPKKFAVVVAGDPKLSEQVQKYLFDKLDARWRGSAVCRVEETNRDVLFLEYENDSGCHRIGYGTEEYLSRVRHIYTVLNLKQEVAIYTPVQTVVIDGKTYSENTILEMIKERGLAPL